MPDCFLASGEFSGGGDRADLEVFALLGQGVSGDNVLLIKNLKIILPQCLSPMHIPRSTQILKSESLVEGSGEVHSEPVSLQQNCLQICSQPIFQVH